VQVWSSTATPEALNGMSTPAGARSSWSAQTTWSSRATGPCRYEFHRRHPAASPPVLLSEYSRASMRSLRSTAAPCQRKDSEAPAGAGFRRSEPSPEICSGSLLGMTRVPESARSRKHLLRSPNRCRLWPGQAGLNRVSSAVGASAGLLRVRLPLVLGKELQLLDTLIERSLARSEGYAEFYRSTAG
jgi:hypothetical protein